MIKISKFLKPKHVVFLDVATRDEALQAMTDVLFQTGELEDPHAFYKAILDREKIVSTGIGMGVAIPHAKLHEYDEFFVAIGILQKGIEWNALDGAPVRLIFMIGGPDDKQTEYLQILSRLTQAIKDESTRKKMLTLNSANAIIDLFRSF
jgi:PTS system nitrogen regulatory IIA component